MGLNDMRTYCFRLYAYSEHLIYDIMDRLLLTLAFVSASAIHGLLLDECQAPPRCTCSGPFVRCSSLMLPRIPDLNITIHYNTLYLHLQVPVCNSQFMEINYSEPVKCFIVMLMSCVGYLEYEIRVASCQIGQVDNAFTVCL